MSKENVDSNSDFLSVMSHELKNSLNIITTMCGMVSSNVDDRDSVLRYIDKICSIAEKIALVMDRSLDINRAGQNKDYRNEKVFTVNELKRELYQLLSPLAEEKAIDFRISSEAIKNSVFKDEYGRLLQILINVATNSIKFTPYGGKVELRFEEAAPNFRFICEDSGIGMTENFVKDIFKPFVRADDERVRAAKGTGLGMSIVKEAVDAMGGDIHIESMIDAGTTVTILLRLKRISEKDD